MSPEANHVYPDIPHRRNPPYIPRRSSAKTPPRVAARRPSPAAFLRSNLHLTPASLAQCDPAAQPEPTLQTGRGRRPDSGVAM